MMESISSFLYFLLSIAFLAIIYALFFSNGPSNLPPGSNGLPFIGESIQFGISGPDKFISDRMKKHSTQVFRTSMLGEKILVFCGSEGNKFVFNNKDNLLSPWLPPSIAKIIGLKQEHLSDSNFKDKFSASLFMTQHLNAILKTDSLKQFIPIFNEIARKHVEDEWKDHVEVKVFPLTQLFSFNIACRYLMGISNADDIKSLGRSFDEARAGIYSVPINLPGTTYYRALRAGKALHEKVSKIIQERRSQENKDGEGLDLLAQVLHQIAPSDTYEESLYDLHLRTLIVGTLFAATSSPAAVITFTLKYLTEMPHIYNQVYQEQMEIAKSKGEEDYLTWDDLNKMEYTWNVVREVLRVVPPIALGGFREAKSSFTYAGYTIPKGWKILWTFQTSHKDPKSFENPEEFNPSRFESSGPASSYSYVPFGGGRGTCPGRDFFKLSMLTLIHIIVTKFILEKVDENEGIKYLMTPFPENGFPVRLIHR